jgi:hypothetical protein
MEGRNQGFQGHHNQRTPGDHGRIETRKTLLIHYVGWQERHQSQA